MEERAVVDDGMDLLRKVLRVLLGVLNVNWENRVFVANDQARNLLAFSTIGGMILVDLKGMSARLCRRICTHEDRHIIPVLFPNFCNWNAGIRVKNGRLTGRNLPRPKECPLSEYSARASETHSATSLERWAWRVGKASMHASQRRKLSLAASSTSRQ
jgi:hypothetical protein